MEAWDLRALRRRAGLTLAQPAWSRGHPLRSFWFVPDNPWLHAYAFAHSPKPMQVRGIMIDPASRCEPLVPTQPPSFAEMINSGVK